MQRAAIGEDYQLKLQAFVDELKTMPIAVETDAANEQHYEVGSPCTSYLAQYVGEHLLFKHLKPGRACCSCRRATSSSAWESI